MLELPLADRSAVLTEAGRRRVNQDAVLVAPLSMGTELIAVADGMGGRSGGEIASSRALEVLRDALAGGLEPGRAVRVANEAVYQHATAHPELEGMGTTLVGVFRRDSQYSVVNVGDSRAYRVDQGGIRQLTEDHSFLADARRSGTISMEEALKSPWRNAVTRAVGTEPDLEVDCFGPFDAREPHTVLLCSDGVYRTLSDEDLRQIVQARPMKEAVRAIAAAAYEGGSDDNISVALIRFGPLVSR
jgi:protein phosphatase